MLEELVAMMKQNRCELAMQMNIGANSVSIIQILTSHSRRDFEAIDASGTHEPNRVSRMEGEKCSGFEWHGKVILDIGCSGKCVGKAQQPVGFTGVAGSLCCSAFRHF